MQILTQKNCVLCGISTNQDLCESCTLHLPQLPVNHCPICLWPAPTAEVCGACLTSLPAFTRTIAALRYTFPVDALIHSLKYQANLAIAPILANLLLQQLETPKSMPDVILPMPLHRSGCANAALIRRWKSAVMFRSNWELRCCLTVAVVSNIHPQTGLPWKDRQKIRKAFSCKMNLSGKHVALVDDVMTTGATLNELAKVLINKGFEISNWVIARTLPEIHQTSSHTQQ